MPQMLLQTKLFIPKRTPRPVIRTFLLEKWLQGLRSGCMVTLICAPAGYGKTTFMLELMDASPVGTAWLSLDEGDNDAQRFCLYLSAACTQAGIHPLGGVDALLQDAGFQSPEAVLTLLLGSVASYSEKLLLVLDDYHLVRSPKVHGLMQFLLAHQPTNLHLALLTREDPPLPLARLRVRDMLIEFRADDLAFGREDTEKLLEAALESKLPAECATLIAAGTEGWVAGIKLYALALKGRSAQDMQAYIQRLAGAQAYIIDYLVEEVLQTQPEEIRRFLRATSVLGRMDGELCDAVTKRKDGREMLKEVSRRNLFLIPLDDRREWFRYHALFADSIRAMLKREEECAICLQAAVHMKSRGFHPEAVEYAFRSGDMEMTLHLVEESTEEAFRTAQLDTLLSWLKRLPEDMVKGSEVLCVRRPIALFITGHMEEALFYIASLGQDFENTASQHNRGLLYCVRAMAAGAAGQDAEPFAREALRSLMPWDPIARTSALNTLGRAQFRKGQLREAADTFMGALESGLKTGYQFVTTLVMMSYSSCLGAMGEYRQALSACEGYLDGMARQHAPLPPYAGILYVTMAGFLKVLGEAKRAEALQSRGEALCKSISYDIHAALDMFRARPDSIRPEPAPAQGLVEKLSSRELAILRLICEGLSNGEIAQRLFISTNTTQWHISHLYGKLGVKSRTQAAAKGRELGLVK